MLDQLKESYIKLPICFGANIKNPIIKIIVLIVMNSSVTVNIFVMIHLWHKKYSLPSTKVLGFVAFRVTSKILGIGSAERSWGYVKTIIS